MGTLVQETYADNRSHAGMAVRLASTTHKHAKHGNGLKRKLLALT